MKVVLVGDAQVGKTCMLSRLTNNSFNETTPATVVGAFQTHTMDTSKGLITIQIWDTAGQEKFRSLAPMYYRAANVAIICFDLTNRRTFTGAAAWADDLAERAAGDIQTIIVGTKSDLVVERTVALREGKELAKSKGAADYLECSAKTGAGIHEVFVRAAELTDPGGAVRVEFGSLDSADESEGCC
jgi:small GTP-binding protein